MFHILLLCCSYDKIWFEHRSILGLPSKVGRLPERRGFTSVMAYSYCLSSYTYWIKWWTRLWGSILPFSKDCKLHVIIAKSLEQLYNLVLESFFQLQNTVTKTGHFWKLCFYSLCSMATFATFQNHSSNSNGFLESFFTFIKFERRKVHFWPFLQLLRPLEMYSKGKIYDFSIMTCKFSNISCNLEPFLFRNKYVVLF